ncbi:phage late control D family protein [Sphingomonas sp. PAMC 26605]|uniref:phage late control D family protein n=1 Tax=Sphingomonas sp. PAMC 26605 TaxID=1112214 RepID=UPI00026CCA45|nr:contractile injection system protein, VgrG/Pvc8 family [Sphingomonas sp. PAMC 26605]
MNLEDFGPRHGEFYVPACTVLVGGRDLVRELNLAVTRVECGLKERAASDFSITVASAFDWEQREFLAKPDSERVDLIDLFAFGAPVEVRIGYGEPSRLGTLLIGTVTRIGTSFTESGTPELTVAGFDNLYPLTIGKQTRHWEDERDSDVVADIAGRNNLTPDVADTGEPRPRTEQSQQSDFEFLGKLAERNGMIFYVRGTTLYFGPRHNRDAPEVALVWGGGLASFSPSANIAKQVTRVEVCGRTEAGEEVTGVAERGDESDDEVRRESGSGHVAQALGREAVLRIRAAVRSQAEATARARAILEERAQDLVTGDGECVGLPEIVPDSNIAISGTSRAFAKTYYVTEATHSLDSEGYRTRFSVREMLV